MPTLLLSYQISVVLLILNSAHMFATRANFKEINKIISIIVRWVPQKICTLFTSCSWFTAIPSHSGRYKRFLAILKTRKSIARFFVPASRNFFRFKCKISDIFHLKMRIWEYYKNNAEFLIMGWKFTWRKNFLLNFLFFVYFCIALYYFVCVFGAARHISLMGLFRWGTSTHFFAIFLSRLGSRLPQIYDFCVSLVNANINVKYSEKICTTQHKMLQCFKVK